MFFNTINPIYLAFLQLTHLTLPEKVCISESHWHNNENNACNVAKKNHLDGGQS